MKLTFLGKGSAYNPAMKNTSAYLPMGKTMLLFDCGETVFETLFFKGLLDAFNEFLIVVTHFHSDHIGSLGSFISYCHCRLHKSVSIFYPEKNICQLLASTGVDETMYTYLDRIPAKLTKDLDIVPYTVRHDPTISCYGYLVKADGASFFYGGDSVAAPEEIMCLLLGKKLGKIYQDVTYEFARESTCHGSLEGLCAQVPKAFRPQVSCMHFDHDFTSKVIDCGFSVVSG